MANRRARVLALLLGLNGCQTGAPPAAEIDQAEAAVAEGHGSPTGALPNWVQIGPDGAVIVKTLVRESTCPALTVDGHDRPMQARSAPTADFLVTLCQLTLPKDTLAATLHGIALVLPKPFPNKILIVGNTGCVIRNDGGQTLAQDCNDATKWGWAQIASTATSEHPDLVVHLGNYQARAVACPAGHSGCSGSAVGDNWEAWDQDFFTPAVPLLEAAPWIFVRGEQERCARAGKGWFYFLDPRPANGGCSDDTAPYAVPAGTHTFAVIDAASEAGVQASLAKVHAVANSVLWLLSHRSLTAATDPQGPSSSALPAALRDGHLGALYTGQASRLALNSYRDGSPPEFIVGNGGALLAPSPLDGHASSGKRSNKQTDSQSAYDFGYLTLEATSRPTVWSLVVHDRISIPLFQCTLHEGEGQQSQLACRATGDF